MIKREEEIREAAEIYSAYVDATDEEDLYNSTELEAFEDGAKWADRHPAKKQAVTIEAWVARDSRIDIGKNTDLFFGKEYPILNKMVGTWGGMEEYYPLPKDALPEVTFENSPKKVKVTIEMEEEK